MDSLAAGAFAGLCVDLSLYPIDTVKTRIQSRQGFIASGGFTNIYKGLSAVAIGSVPGGAAFFVAYDTVKRTLLQQFGIPLEHNASLQMNSTVFACQALAAMCGECFACCIRVPVEMVKQQMQAGHHHSIRSALHCITHNISPSEMRPGNTSIALRGSRHLFAGMPITLLRELPFSVIQMSIYELQKYLINRSDSTLRGHYYELLPLCGAVSGGTAAFLTTPLDVIKTRIMLKTRQSFAFSSIPEAVREIASEAPRPGDRFGAPQKFFRGAATRVVWISFGGSIFFGTYEFVMRAFHS